MAIFSRRRAVVAGALVAAVAAAGTAARSQPTQEPVAGTLAWALDARYLGREGVRMQSGEVDCGVAVLAMILEHHGRAPRLDGVRRDVLERGQGLSLLEMQGIAAGRGLRATGWRMDLPALARSPLPAVAHFDDHFVVVDRVDADGTVWVRDPSIGRLALSSTAFGELWTGEVLLLGPVPPPPTP